ncbi:MAG: hypothetical protein MnENMB40S_16130 [Rhizobiaceae bacterium MnEN-MB40S]|nr:MAG: hypothetical protein MnENMB40S_16130 [Rhizobiaceae bacterium MnEN-MB40S]
MAEAREDSLTDTASSWPAFRHIIEFVVSACMLVAGTMLVILIGTMGWLVFGRYVLNDTPTWVEQLSLVLVVWITFLGGAACVWRKSHLGVDFIRDAMSFNMQIVLRLIASALMAAFGVCMAWQGGLLATGTWARRIPMLEISEGWRAVPMVVSGGLIALFALFELAALVNQLLAVRSRNIGG